MRRSSQEARRWPRTCSIGRARRRCTRRCGGSGTRAVGRRAGRSAGRGDAPRRAAGASSGSRERSARSRTCASIAGTALSLGLGRGRAPGVCVPRLDVRPGRRLHPDPRQPRDEHPEQGADRRLPRGRARRPDLGVPRATASPAMPLPAFPEWADDAYRKIKIPQYDWHCSAARRVENFVDFSHFAWVHEGILGDRSKPEIPDHDVVRDATTLSFELGIEEPANPVKGDAGDAGRIQRDAEPVHDLDAVLGAPRPAAGGRPPLRAVRRVVPAVGQGDPQLHLERAQLRARPGRATRASSTSSR